MFICSAGCNSNSGADADFGSVASARRFLIVETLADGEERYSHSCVYECCIDIHIQDSLPPGGSPFKDSNEEDSPDEVCLAVQTLAHVCPVNQLRKSYRSNHIPFDGSRIRRLGAVCHSRQVPSRTALIYSLCRMTCLAVCRLFRPRSWCCRTAMDIIAARSRSGNNP